MSSKIFSLDIGTRSVVGTILQEVNGNYEVLDLITVEHKERSMIDGQIHNILTVAEVIRTIKKQLEEKHGPLKQVSVAAAGRALLTEKGILSIDLTQEKITSIEDLNRLELAAVQVAQKILLKNECESNRYYCVGYSVLQYKLDDQAIGDLIDQTGLTASIHVIATFLPQVVIESLLSALQHAELEMTALTLEPIAAIHVLVPPSMRKLNIALVDIGAGTSDIAIANNGTITAYGMVPLAGDEVTDALCQEYLIDFPIAENVKRQLTEQETVEMVDILGFPQVFPSSEVCAQIAQTSQDISTAIAREILQLNNKEAPKAVILVGGGSLTPGLSAALSEALELPETRVAIRGLDALSGVTVSSELGQSPELVTPIGIAIAAKKAPLHYMSITVNAQQVRLFELKEMTIGDALIASNFSMEDMYGKPGRGITITFNGKTLAIPGEMGRPSVIHLNGEKSDLKRKIKNGDNIEIKTGANGKDANPMIHHLVDDLQSVHVKINDQPISLAPEILINGEKQHENIFIRDRDKVDVVVNTTLQHALSKWGGEQKRMSFSLTVDQKPMRVKKWEETYFLNQLPIRTSYHLQPNDHVIVQTPVLPTIEALAEELEMQLTEKILVTFNDAPVKIRKPRFTVYQNQEIASGESRIHDGDHIAFVSTANYAIVFSDIFAFTAYELPNNPGGRYELLRNDQPIQLNEPIFQGDRLAIKFARQTD